jgi:hypothetical protein
MSQDQAVAAPSRTSTFRNELNDAVGLTAHQDIVLTDSDFGRAYLTEGWARRFLVDLFRHFTVLFVGYSHSDTVMHYLARALPEQEAGRVMR